MSVQSLIERYTIPAIAPGATYVQPHTLHDANGAIAPNFVMPTAHGTPVRPVPTTGVTATAVTFENISAEPSDPVDYSLRYDHSIQRSSDQGAPGLLFVYAGPSGGAAGGVGSYIERNGQTDVAGSLTPVDQILDVYVQGTYGASGAWLGPGQPGGDDSNPGTKDLPFETPVGVYQRFGRRGIQGVTIRVNIGGYSVPPPGGWPVTPAVNDPWDGYPEQDRVVLSREMLIEGSDCFRAGFCYVWPRKLFPATAAVLPYVNSTQVGNRVRHNFSAPTGLAPSARGAWLVMRRTDDDRDVYYPHVISEVTGGGTQVWTEAPFTAADWMADFAASGARMAGMVPAAQWAGDPDYENGGVLIHGSGGGHIGDGRTAGAPATRNPQPHGAYGMIIRPTLIANGQTLWCNMWWDDGTEFNGGAPILKGCSGGPNGYVRWSVATGRKLNADSNYTPNGENTGWALVSALPVPVPTSDPEVQTGGPGELVVTGDCNLIIADAMGAGPGQLRIIHGLAVICSTGRIPVEVRGKGSLLWVSGDVARPAFLTLVTPGAVPCMWAVGGAEIMTNSGQMQLSNGGGGTMRAGAGAAIASGAGAGEYLEPAPGHAGNFTNRLVLNGALGQAADDDSRICDDTWMPADYSGAT